MATSVREADRPRTILIGSLLMAVSGLVYNMLPVILGAAADSLSLTHRQTGYLASAYLAGFSGVPFTAPLWVRRTAWRRTLLAALTVIAASFAFCALVATFSAALLGMMAAGAGAGALLSVAVTGFGDATQSERAFTAGQTASLSLSAIGVWTLPVWLIPKYGFPGVLWAMAGPAIVVACLVRWFPGSSVKKNDLSSRGHGPMSVLTVSLGMTGIGLFYLGLAALWSFLERIGKEGGIDAHSIGVAFSLEKVAVLLVCAGAYWQGKRFGLYRPLITACIGVLLATGLLAGTGGPLGYIAAVMIFGAFWTYSYPYQMAAITSADRDGRYSGAIPAFIGAGSTLGPSIAGQAVIGSNYGTVYILVAACCLLGTGLLLLTARRAEILGGSVSEVGSG